MRTFIALPLPEEVKAVLLQAQEEWRRQFPGPVSWTRPEGFHLTLKFLGEIQPEQISGIEEVLARVSSASAPLDLSLDQCGAFPNARSPRVLVVGIHSEALSELALRVEEGLEALGFPREKRRFNGHVTLGRVREFRKVELCLPLLASAAWQARELVLYQSHLSPRGSHYERLFVTALSRGCADNP